MELYKRCYNYNKCSVNNCPLDSEAHKRVNARSETQVCELDDFYLQKILNRSKQKVRIRKYDVKSNVLK